MSLRDPLVPFEPDEAPDVFMARALHAARECGGSGRLRVELGEAFSLSTGKSYVAASLYVERGHGRTESWQRVTPSICGGSFAEILPLFARALDEQRAARSAP